MLYQIYKLELMARLVYLIRHGCECCASDNMSDRQIYNHLLVKRSNFLDLLAK